MNTLNPIHSRSGVESSAFITDTQIDKRLEESNLNGRILKQELPSEMWGKVFQNFFRSGEELLAIRSVCKGWKDLVEFEVKNKAPLPEKEIPGRVIKKFWKAVEEGAAEKVDMFLRFRGICVDIQDKDGYKVGGGSTPLVRAVENSHLTLLTKLIDAGASVNAQDHYGCPALNLAFDISYHSRNLEVITQLVQAGANVNNSYHMAPLTIAASQGYVEIVKQLLEAGADVNYKDRGEKTALTKTVDKIRINKTTVTTNEKHAHIVPIAKRRTAIMKCLINNGAHIPDNYVSKVNKLLLNTDLNG